MTEKILENFSIAQICESGQCFRMEKIQDGRYQVIAGDRYLELEQQGNRVRFDCTEVEYRDFWRHYFDIETDFQNKDKLCERTAAAIVKIFEDDDRLKKFHENSYMIAEEYKEHVIESKWMQLIKNIP